jgi:hypothetical protein
MRSVHGVRKASSTYPPNIYASYELLICWTVWKETDSFYFGDCGEVSSVSEVDRKVEEPI